MKNKITKQLGYWFLTTLSLEVGAVGLILGIFKSPFSNEAWPVVSSVLCFFLFIIPIFTFLLFLANDFLSSDFMNPRRKLVKSMEDSWNARPKIKKITVDFDNGLTTFLEGDEAQEWGRISYFKTNGIFDCGNLPTNWKKETK